MGGERLGVGVPLHPEVRVSLGRVPMESVEEDSRFVFDDLLDGGLGEVEELGLMLGWTTIVPIRVSVEALPSGRRPLDSIATPWCIPDWQPD